MKERQLYVGWVGDSKALLVSQNRVLQIVNPHKPDSEVNTGMCSTKNISRTAFTERVVCALALARLKCFIIVSIGFVLF